MFINNWKKEILTIPNLLSLMRLVLIPVYIRLYLKAREPFQFYAAGAVMAASCLTDAVDGWIARHCNMVSTLGKILDPLADKATQFALTLCLSLKYPVLYPVLILFTVKETFQLTIGIIHLLRGQMLPGALAAGKICTVTLFISLILLVLIPELPAVFVDTIALLDGTFLILSFISYFLAYFGKQPKVQNVRKNSRHSQ